MRRDKLKLTDLRVNSFVTELNADNINTVKGGSVTNQDTNTDTMECESQAVYCETYTTCTPITNSIDDVGCSQQQATGRLTNCNGAGTLSGTVV